MSLPASAAQATLAQVTMELRLTARRSENVLVTAIIPAVVLVFFASVDPGGITGDPLDFLVPGALTLAVIAASLVNLGIATGYERHYGVLKRLGGSPLTRPALLIAKVSTVLVVEVLQFALLGAIAVWLGWRPGPEATGAILFVAAWLLGTAAFAGLGLFLAGTLRAEATLAVTNAAFIACLLLGGIVVPVDQLPEPLAALASVLPAAALSESFRIALGATGDAAREYAILAAWAIGAVTLTARTFRWE